MTTDSDRKRLYELIESHERLENALAYAEKAGRPELVIESIVDKINSLENEIEELGGTIRDEDAVESMRIRQSMSEIESTW